MTSKEQALHWAEGLCTPFTFTDEDKEELIRYIEDIDEKDVDSVPQDRELSQEQQKLIALVDKVEASDELTRLWRGRYGTDFNMMRILIKSGMLKRSAITYLKKITK